MYNSHGPCDQFWRQKRHFVRGHGGWSGVVVARPCVCHQRNAVLGVATQEAAYVADADHLGPMPSSVEGHHLVLEVFLYGSNRFRKMEAIQQQQFFIYVAISTEEVVLIVDKNTPRFLC